MKIFIDEMKYCPKCKEDKALSEFHKNRSCKDNLQIWCKVCRADNYQSHKVERVEYGRSYYQTHKKEIAEQKRSPAGREVQRRADKKKYERYPEKCRARQAVQYAVETGRLIRPPICSSCDMETFTEAHHEDYSKPLEVKWLCEECHREAERLIQSL